MLPKPQPDTSGVTELEASERTRAPLSTTAATLLETADLQDRLQSVFGQANRRLRWALGASLVSSVVIVLQEFGSLLWLTSGSDYFLNAAFFVAVAVAFWVRWIPTAREARTLDRELESRMLETRFE